MKKIYLLLCVAFLLCFSVMAQKNLKMGFIPISKNNKKSTERNHANIRKQNNITFSQTKTLQTLSGYYLESFEGTFPPAGWTKQDPDGGSGWAQIANGTTPLPGWNGGVQTVPTNGDNNAAYCSYNTGGASSNDQWLISPQFTVASGDSLAFNLWWFGAYVDTLEVRISTASNSIADFTTLVDLFDTVRLIPMSSWNKFSYSLAAYAGQNIYVAFRERISDNQTNGAYLSLDLFSIGKQTNNDVEPLSIDIAPIIGVGPTTPMATVTNIGLLPETFNVTMKATGGYTSTQQVTALPSGSLQQLTFSSWNAPLGNDSITVYTQLANDTNKTNDTISKTISVVNLTKAYCYVDNDPTGTLPSGPAYTYLQIPSNIISLADQSTSNAIYGGTWGLGNKWYGTVYTDNTLITMDTVTGARTVIGKLGVEIDALAYDYSTHKLFGEGYDGNSTSLYSISTLTGAATLVGTSSTDILSSLACDTSGNLYSVGISNDMFYSVDKHSGNATSIGAVGFDANNIESLAFDYNTNSCYFADYDNGTSAGELSLINITTGVATYLGTFENSAEMSGFVIPHNASIPAHDASVSGVVTPKSACNLTSAETLSVSIDNLGSSAISNFNISYSINGGTPVTEIVSSTITPNTSLTYTFTNHLNLSATGTYSIKVYSALSNDAFKSNDTLNYTVTNIANSTVPYSMGFEPTEDFSAWTIEDANADNNTWFYYPSYGNNAAACAVYVANQDGATAADDWLITKCIDLTAGKTYKVSYYYEVGDSTLAESLNVNIGTSPISTAMTTLLISYPSLTNINYLQGDTIFTVPTSETYYLGFHCVSAAGKYALLLDDFNISDVTGIKETPYCSNINVYPIPAKNILNISSTENISNIKIMNVFGQVIYTESINGNNTVINTSAYAEGIYFIQMQTAKGFVTKNITIQK